MPNFTQILTILVPLIFESTVYLVLPHGFSQTLQWYEHELIRPWWEPPMLYQWAPHLAQLIIYGICLDQILRSKVNSASLRSNFIVMMLDYWLCVFFVLSSRTLYWLLLGTAIWVKAIFYHWKLGQKILHTKAISDSYAWWLFVALALESFFFSCWIGTFTINYNAFN